MTGNENSVSTCVVYFSNIYTVNNNRLAMKLNILLEDQRQYHRSRLAGWSASDPGDVAFKHRHGRRISWLRVVSGVVTVRPGCWGSGTHSYVPTASFRSVLPITGRYTFWPTVLLQKLTSPPLIKKLISFLATRSLMTMFITARYLFLSLARLVHALSSCFLNIRFNIIIPRSSKVSPPKPSILLSSS